jgi:hypothetical protein
MKTRDIKNVYIQFECEIQRMIDKLEFPKDIINIAILSSTKAIIQKDRKQLK